MASNLKLGVAIAVCAAAATYFFTAAPQTYALSVNNRVLNRVRSVQYAPVTSLRAIQRADLEAPLQAVEQRQLDGLVNENVVDQGLSKKLAPILFAVSGALLFIAGALLRQVPKRALNPQYAMLATVGEEGSNPVKEAETQGLAISRRGMAPLFTGAMLSPSLSGLPAWAADAPSAPVASAAGVAIDNPKKWIESNLPGSIPSKEFVRVTADILAKQGMEPTNTVACVGVCRDEMCEPLVDEIESEWGDAFNMTSLGGMLTLGKTGLQAAMAHSPVDEDGKERYFFLAFPHIAVDTTGLGQCTRPGRPKLSKACGALYALTNELKAGKNSTQPDALDPEYSYMKAAVLNLLPQGTAPDLLEVTKTAAEASLEQLEQLVAATVDPKKADYAICVGVLVHEQDLRSRSAKVIGPARQYVDQVWPIAFYSVKNGRKKDLIWRLERD